MEIKGKIHEIGSTIQATDKLTKRELIVEYIENPQYPEYLKFEMINDKCKLLDGMTVGSDVEVFFNLKGRPWTDKTGKKTYFNSLALWKINVLNAAAQQQPAQNEISSAPDDDDLSF